MAKYIVLRVESNDTADQLLARFEPVKAITVVGLFASPTTFCEGPPVCRLDGRIVRSRKYGITHCRTCKKPIKSLPQEPRNLLQDEDLHPRFVDMRLSVWEPFKSPDPSLVYGAEAIQRKKNQVKDAGRRVRRYLAKQEREADGG